MISNNKRTKKQKRNDKRNKKNKKTMTKQETRKKTINKLKKTKNKDNKRKKKQKPKHLPLLPATNPPSNDNKQKKEQKTKDCCMAQAEYISCPFKVTPSAFPFTSLRQVDRGGFCVLISNGGREQVKEGR